MLAIASANLHSRATRGRVRWPALLPHEVFGKLFDSDPRLFNHLFGDPALLEEFWAAPATTSSPWYREHPILQEGHPPGMLVPIRIYGDGAAAFVRVYALALRCAGSFLGELPTCSGSATGIALQGALAPGNAAQGSCACRLGGWAATAPGREGGASGEECLAAEASTQKRGKCTVVCWSSACSWRNETLDARLFFTGINHRVVDFAQAEHEAMVVFAWSLSAGALEGRRFSC